MKRLLLSLLLATSLIMPSHALDQDGVDALINAHIEQQAAPLHQSAMYLLAGRLLEQRTQS
ncbi:MAG: hypothetical protein ACK4ZJ_00045 [Allorhizobium sp.]